MLLSLILQILCRSLLGVPAVHVLGVIWSLSPSSSVVAVAVIVAGAVDDSSPAHGKLKTFCCSCECPQCS